MDHVEPPPSPECAASYHLALAPIPSAATCARLHARHVLHGWDLAGLSGEVELIVSELVTNAIRASRQVPWEPPIGLDLRVSEKLLFIEVWDQAPMDPQPCAAGPDAGHGRGLQIVEALSSQWGWDRVDPWLKRVWSTIDLV